MSSIRLSEQHGVNPSLMVCFFCGEDMGVALLGKLPGDKQAPHRGVFSREPCRQCEGHMKKGCLLLCVDEKKTTDPKNPYRTGPMAVVKDEAISRMFDAATAEAVLKGRFAFVSDDAWTKMGLPQ